MDLAAREFGAMARQRTSKCIGCPFDAVLDFHATTQLVTQEWVLRIRDARHNHGSMPKSTIPLVRRQQLAESETHVNAQIENGTSIRRIMTNMRMVNPDTALSSQDIRNHRFGMRTRGLSFFSRSMMR